MEVMVEQNDTRNSLATADRPTAIQEKLGARLKWQSKKLHTGDYVHLCHEHKTQCSPVIILRQEQMVCIKLHKLEIRQS